MKSRLKMSSAHQNDRLLQTCLPLVLVSVFISIMVETNARPHYYTPMDYAYFRRAMPPLEEKTEFQRFPQSERAYIVMVDDPVIVIVPDGNASTCPPDEAGQGGGIAVGTEGNPNDPFVGIYK